MPTRMYPDLEEARRHHAALKEIFARPDAGGLSGCEALPRVEELCWAAASAVDDAYCRENIGIVADYAAGMLCAGRQRTWGEEPHSGTEFLRLQILKVLDAFHSRLHSLEAIRRAGARRLPPFSSASGRP